MIRDWLCWNFNSIILPNRTHIFNIFMVRIYEGRASADIAVEECQSLKGYGVKRV